MTVLPFFMWRAYDLLVLVVLLGITSSMVFSSSYQIVSHFPASSNVALTTGKRPMQDLAMQALFLA